VAFESRRPLHGRLEDGFTIVFMAFVSVLVSSIMIHVAEIYRSSGLKELLAASRKTPWGIITSLFVHDNEAHLLNNMIALFTFLMLLVTSNAFLPKEEMKRRIVSSLSVIFLLPVLLNLSFIFFFRDVRMIGSSGMVYALEGRCLGLSLLNALELRRIRNHIKNERKVLLASSLSNLTVFVGFLLNLALFPEVFLGSGPQTVATFHSLAFFGGFLTVLVYVVWRRLKGKYAGGSRPTIERFRQSRVFKHPRLAARTF